MSRAEPLRTHPTRSAQAPGTLQWIPTSLAPEFAGQGTTAYRLASSFKTWVERLGEDVLISYQHEQGLGEARAGLAEWSEQTGWTPRRLYARFLPRQNADRSTPELLTGEAGTPPTGIADEAGLHYGIDFSAGYSAGLFLDQRANRRFIRSLPPGRLLNTFAYTCSFSVAAASAGWTTFSVDLSKKSVDRGRFNFGLNGLPQEGHTFLADDVLEVLPRLQRRGETFDAIILDPPTFSRGNRGRRFQVEENMPDLIRMAIEVANPGARILISTNCTALGVRDLEWMARDTLKGMRRSGEFMRTEPLPDIDAEFGAKTVWLLLR